MRRLPYGANYLAWSDMDELKRSIDSRILFRYLAPTPTAADTLEQTVQARFGTKRCLALHNCTEALRLSLMATRPRAGDEIHIPAVTFVAVAGAVLSCGLIPVLVDVDEQFALDPDRLPDSAERVIVAHMEGHVGRFPDAPEFTIEDTAQAIGGSYPDGALAGTRGFTGAFSFHHNKLLTSGEGGLLVTNDLTRFEDIRRYHDHGCIRKQGEYPRWQDDAFFGENFVASEIVASVQLQQLRHLDQILAGLERGYATLRAEVADAGFQILERAPGDVKTSVRIVLPDRVTRDGCEARLKTEALASWTLDRYFLPAHPVLRGRRSLYADGFPWNLARFPPQDPGLFEGTRRRLERVLCLMVAPELQPEEQQHEARRYAAALRGGA